ncbi:hypothetical protein Ahy_B04g070093 [Arachis hypogaea]|uniref:Peptidase A2 domain-containing protein n=1 Tax=Arachis hypogaea TaxID=3818 RepID=A0A444ZER3_ARAHY|nr:hypothetical protein Ahy_B04g070093 [Arachis hypogaea]
MVSTISIIPTEYLGEYEGNPCEDYDVEDEEVFSFIRYEDEPGYFQRLTEKQKFHLRPLHITTSMSGIKVNKVLIDGGAAISLLPERMLMKVGKHHDDLIPTNILVTEYTGVSTHAKGLVTLVCKVDLLIKILSLWLYHRRPVIMRYWDVIGSMVLELYHQPCIKVFFCG